MDILLEQLLILRAATFGNGEQVGETYLKTWQIDEEQQTCTAAASKTLRIRVVFSRGLVDFRNAGSSTQKDFPSKILLVFRSEVLLWFCWVHKPKRLGGVRLKDHRGPSMRRARQEHIVYFFLDSKVFFWLWVKKGYLKNPIKRKNRQACTSGPPLAWGIPFDPWLSQRHLLGSFWSRGIWKLPQVVLLSLPSSASAPQKQLIAVS